MFETINRITGELYVYCTDFIINLANLAHLSYYEVNVLIFCIAWPLTTMLLLVNFLRMKMKLKKRHQMKG